MVLATPVPFSSQVAVVELPFGFVSSDSVGGAGGTCVIRGCVPKKLLVYACVHSPPLLHFHTFTPTSAIQTRYILCVTDILLTLCCSSEFSEGFEDAQGFGWGEAKPPHDIKALIARKVRTLVLANNAANMEDCF